MTFGQGDVGQLGLGEDMMERKKPSPVCGELEGKKIVQVVCGGMHTVAVSEDGKVHVRVTCCLLQYRKRCQCKTLYAYNM